MRNAEQITNNAYIAKNATKMRVIMSKMCLVVPRTSLEVTGFLAPPQECKLTLLDRENALRLNNIIMHGTLRDREGGLSVEVDPTYKQIIPYMFVFDSSGRALFYQRNTDASYYNEKRLAGKVSLGIGGHMTENDIWQGVFREFREEAQLIVNGQIIEFSSDNAGLLRFNSMLNPRLAAIIDDRRDSVGEVHLGVVVATYLQPDYVVVMKSGDKGESTGYEYVSPSEYYIRVRSGKFEPEGWTSKVVDELLVSFAILNS
jgi:predicted NUDIX family phosphoesterase